MSSVKEDNIHQQKKSGKGVEADLAKGGSCSKVADFTLGQKQTSKRCSFNCFGKRFYLQAEMHG